MKITAKALLEQVNLTEEQALTVFNDIELLFMKHNLDIKQTDFICALAFTHYRDKMLALLKEQGYDSVVINGKEVALTKH